MAQVLLLAGDHLLVDVLCDQNKIELISGPKVVTSNTHGTGCTTASAIAAFLARGESIESAVRHARNYMTETLQASSHLWIGSGPQRPVNHL